jgi:hypothetical protein
MESFFNLIRVSSTVPPKLCILLDIDETMIQYVNYPIGRDYEYFNHITIPIRNPPKPNPIVVFRPFLDVFFKFVSQNNIHLGIWTYGGYFHAQATANHWIPFFIENIEKEAGIKLNPPIKFDFVYCDKDYTDWKNNREDGHHKDLRMIYERHPHWTPENTIIIDNSIFNINHIHNVSNGILIQPFQPSSNDLFSYEDAKNDHVFLDDIIPICYKLIHRDKPVQRDKQVQRDKSLSIQEVLEPYKFKVSSDSVAIFTVGNKIHNHEGDYIFVKREIPHLFERAKKRTKKNERHNNKDSIVE